ncbi:MAG: hypothetical protein L3J67_13140 [Hyphomicrobiaceae bacterium]|nr:hypothetical protein [Hyphomicrobiaceae bacterium]
MTAAQIEKLKEKLDNRHEDNEVYRLIDGHFEKHKKCPHCFEVDLQSCGQKNGLHRWLCMGCGKSFNALTGTPLAGLRKKEKWLGYMRALIEGVSVRKAADKADISTNTSFRWRHRMLEAQKNMKGQDLNGVGEVDETFFEKASRGPAICQENQKGVARKPKNAACQKSRFRF